MAYQVVYFLILGASLFMLFPYFVFNDGKKSNELTTISCLLVIIAISIFFGFRGRVGTDTSRYVEFFNSAKQYKSLNGYLSSVQYNDPFFYVVNYYLSRLVSFPVFSSLVSIFFFSSILRWASIKNRKDLFPILINLLALFSIYSLNTNILRACFAIACFFTFLYYKEKHKPIAWLWMVISVTSHLTTILLVVAYFAAKIIKKDILYYAFWLVCVALSISGFGITSIPIIADKIAESEKYSVYLQVAEFTYRTGFRADFTAFNLFFVGLGLLTYWKKKAPYYFRMYLFLTGIFVLWYVLPFSDRVGLYSWIFIPYIVVDFVNTKFLRRNALAYWVYYGLLIFITGISFVIIG